MRFDSSLIGISNHAVTRFKQRSGLAGVDRLSNTAIRKAIIKLLVKYGHVVRFSGIIKLRLMIVEVAYSTEGEDKTLYFLMKPNPRKKERKNVVTVFTKRQFGLYLQRVRLIH